VRWWDEVAEEGDSVMRWDVDACVRGLGRWRSELTVGCDEERLIEEIVVRRMRLSSVSTISVMQVRSVVRYRQDSQPWQGCFSTAANILKSARMDVS
jgi:hypothetical protein